MNINLPSKNETSSSSCRSDGYQTFKSTDLKQQRFTVYTIALTINYSIQYTQQLLPYTIQPNYSQHPISLNNQFKVVHEAPSIFNKMKFLTLDICITMHNKEIAKLNALHHLLDNRMILRRFLVLESLHKCYN